MATLDTIPTFRSAKYSALSRCEWKIPSPQTDNIRNTYNTHNTSITHILELSKRKGNQTTYRLFFFKLCIIFLKYPQCPQWLRISESFEAKVFTHNTYNTSKTSIVGFPHILRKPFSFKVLQFGTHLFAALFCSVHFEFMPNT